MIELLIIHITIRKQHDVLNFKLIDTFFGSPTPPSFSLFQCNPTNKILQFSTTTTIHMDYINYLL